MQQETKIQDIMRYEGDIWSVADLLIAASVKQSDFPAFMMPFFAVMMLEGRMRNAAKAVEVEFGVTADVPFAGVPLRNLNLKNNLLVAGIIRENGETLIPSGNDSFRPGDDVIIVTTNTDLTDLRDIVAK